MPEPIDSVAPESRTRRALALLILITTAARLALGRRYFGFNSGDDVEILEEGFRRVLDLQYVPLEIRNLLLSDLLVAPALWIASALGVDSSSTLAWVSIFPFVALASLNVLLVFAIGRHWLGDERAALCAATLYGCHWLPLGFGSTVYPRTASVACFLAAVWLLAGEGGERRRAAAAGALGALAFTFRYSEGVYLAPLLAVLLWRRRPWRAAVAALLAFLAGFVATCLVTVGLYDWLTLGRPFASLEKLVTFVLVERQTTAERAVQPWYWYLRRLPKWLPPTLLPLLVPAAARPAGRRALVVAALPVVLLSAIHLKRLRYLQGVVPFICLAAACGALVWWRLGRRKTMAVLLATSLLLSLGGLTFLQKKSMAAVLAARSLASDPGAGCVALAQPWAYGDRLFLRHETELRALPMRPVIADLESTVPGCDRVGLYADDVDGSSELAAWLEDRDFRRSGTFRWGRSREVTLFTRE